VKKEVKWCCCDETVILLPKFEAKSPHIFMQLSKNVIVYVEVSALSARMNFL
jgi:hypothetical protein